MSGFDLHIHSNHSDGKLSVQKIASIVKEKGLDYCALTDHNSVAGVQELAVAFEGYKTKIIPATELTAKLNDNEVHILAYDFNVDLAAKIIEERNKIVSSQKIKEMELAIKLSRQAELEVSNGLISREKQPVSLTVALDICANENNQKIFLKKYGKQFTPEDVYFEYQAPGKACAVERSGVTVEWLVKKFKEIAQDLILAHPFVSVSVVTKPLNESEIGDLFKIGLTGVEIYHNNTTVEQIALLKRIVKEQSVHYTGGSDSHGRATDTPIGQYSPNSLIPNFFLKNYSSDFKKS